jgi:hypothetical protein
MKACFKCNRCLPLTEFYKHPMMGDGHLGKCKECARLDVRANREKRRDYYLEYDRRRSRTPERRAGIRLSQVKWSDRQRARVLRHSSRQDREAERVRDLRRGNEARRASPGLRQAA